MLKSKSHLANATLSLIEIKEEDLRFDDHLLRGKLFADRSGLAGYRARFQDESEAGTRKWGPWGRSEAEAVAFFLAECVTLARDELMGELEDELAV